MPKVIIDGKEFDAKAGEPILECALRNGIEIPYFCYHKNLSIAANCRMCMVRINDMKKLVPSCNTPVTEGMKVETTHSDVIDARKSVLQFITLNHPVDCGICDKAGECMLQDNHFKYNGEASKSSVPKVHKPKFADISENIFIDNERCILCTRCVRFTSEISKSNTLGIMDRGNHSLVERVTPKEQKDHYLENIVDICPVGALLSKSFLYQSRVWYLMQTKSVCPGCERGCSINIHHRKPEWIVTSLDEKKNKMIYRVTPVENSEINGPWICDKARTLPSIFERKRQTHISVEGVERTFAETIALVKSEMVHSKKVGMLLSLWGSNEELQALKEANLTKVDFLYKEDHTLTPGELSSDSFLIKANKNPNKKMVMELFNPRTTFAHRDYDLLIVWGEGLDPDILHDTQKVIHLTSFEDRMNKKAKISFPISTMLERDGTFTNFEGVKNSFTKVFEKPSTVYDASEIFKALK